MTRFEIIARCCRVIPAGLRGKTRLLKASLASQLGAKDVEVNDRFGNHYVVPSLREPIGFHLLIDGVYEEEVLAFILQRLEKESVFVDVGANIGVITIPAARKVGAAGKVLAIEASPTIYRYLERNVGLNHLENARCVNVAASNEQGNLSFFEAPLDHFGMGSLSVKFGAQPTLIPARSLDQIFADEKIERIDLIKMDIEGFELKAFQGAEQLLKRDKPPLIIFEFYDWAESCVPGAKAGDAQRLLMGLGFSLWRMKDFAKGRPPLSEPVVKGFDMIVASK